MGVAVSPFVQHRREILRGNINSDPNSKSYWNAAA
jgi:hypothetical protein